MFSSSPLYLEDIKGIVDSVNKLEEIKNSTVVVTGATGLIGTVIIDSLMYGNKYLNSQITIVAVSRKKQNIEDRFHHYLDDPYFRMSISDISDPAFITSFSGIDYIIHLASNTHPKLYQTKPIETIETIIQGTRNVLELAAKNDIKRLINASSVEVYGENRGDVDRFSEEYLGYIDSNTLRAGYTESKRLAEAFIQAYISEKDVDALSIRFGRVYGATFLNSDTKSTSQFIRSAVSGDDIILKSKGMQEYSHVYVADAVSATLLLLTRGERGEAYNVSHNEVKTLGEVAGIIAEISGSPVEYNIPSNSTETGASVVQKALMDNSKIEIQTGWAARYDIREGMRRTINILQGNKL